MGLPPGNFQSSPFDKLRAGSTGLFASRISTQDCVLGLEFLHFLELRIGRRKHFAVFGSTNRFSCASPGLQSGGAGFQTRENVPVYKFRALTLGAGRPIPSPEAPMTKQTAPVTRSSPLWPDSPKCTCGGVYNPLRRERGDSRNSLAIFQKQNEFPVSRDRP
jgi:hypothetical protein